MCNLRIIILFSLLAFFIGCQRPKEKGKAPSSKEVKFIHFNDMEEEKISDKISRRYVTGGDLSMAVFLMKKSAHIPKHKYPAEQIRYILKGSIKFKTKDATYIVEAGDVLIVPPDVLHEYWALEDTIDLQIYSPPREDWINRTDFYLRKIK